MPATDLPRPGFGTWSITDPDRCAERVATALEAGYRHVDTAQMYDNEAYVGRGIRESAVPRGEVFLATKVHHRNCARENVLSTARASLDRLGMDSVDLLYVHWPRAAYDAADTLPAFDELRDAGAIDHVGLSNFTPALLDEAREVLDAPIFAHQVEMHPLLPQEELRNYAREHDHWLVAYCPLARGQVFDVPEIREVAEKHGATPAQVSLAWLLSKDRVVPIPQSSDPDHIRENVAARGLDLDPEDVERIDAIDREVRVVDPADAAWNR
ncbi:MAG: aldo/keto reductase [Halobacteriales archaeon]